MKYYLLFIFSLLSLTVVKAQVHDHDHDHSHDHHHHHEEEVTQDHKNELAIGNAPIYFINDKENSFGMHFHYLRKWKNRKFGAGILYERIFNENRYNTIVLLGNYNVTNEWKINLGPAIGFEDQDQDLNFAMLFETAYEFMIHDFHLGPFFLLAFDNQGPRASLGLHLGYGF